MTSDRARVGREQEGTSNARSTGLSHFIDPIFLMLVGLAAVVDGARIIMTKREVVGGVEAGAWIATLGALLLAGSGILAMASARHTADVTSPDALLKPPALAFVLLVLYVSALDRLGYILATALFMAVYLRLFGRYGLIAVAAIAIAFAAGSGWLWSFMNMMLPQGPIVWP